MTRFGKYLVLATGFAILAIVGTLTNGTSKALAESDTFTTIDFPGASVTNAWGSTLAATSWDSTPVPVCSMVFY